MKMTAIECLWDMVNQHCMSSDGKLDSACLSADSDAMRLLAQMGYLAIDREYGRRIIGHWTEKKPWLIAAPNGILRGGNKC